MNNTSWDELIPLRQKNSDEYIPSIQQIIDYAEFIGLEFPGDQHLLYLAKQGITASLPQEWQACQTPTGDMVYRNIITKQIQAEHPLDLIYRTKVLEIKNSCLDSYFTQQFDLTKRSSLPAIEQERAQFSQSSLSDHFQPIGKGSQAKTHSEETFKNQQKAISNPSGSRSLQNKKQHSTKLKDSFNHQTNHANSNSSSNKSIEANQTQKSFQLNLKEKMPDKNEKMSENQQKQQNKQKRATPKSMQIYSSRNNEHFQGLHHSETTFANKNFSNSDQANPSNDLFNQFMQMQQDNIKRRQEQKRVREKLEIELEHATTEKQLKLNLLNQLQQANQAKLALIKTKIHAKMHRNIKKNKEKP